MYEQVEKSKESIKWAVANSVAQKKSIRKQTFGLVDNRPESVSQRKLQDIANQHYLAKQSVQLKSFSKNVIQKSDLFDFGHEDGYKRQEGGPLPVLKKTGDGYAFDDNFLVEKIQLRGGRSNAHSEVFCIIFRSRYNKGVFRFSRSQAGDTFQKQAKLEKGNWPVVAETDVLSKGIKVAKAESLAQQVHDSMTHYISGNCHDFADKLYKALQIGTLPMQNGDENFM